MSIVHVTKKLYSADNLMDPGPVPAELQGLSQVEEMLISAVMPIMSVYRLPHGQLGYNGHVVNLPQDVGLKVYIRLHTNLLIPSTSYSCHYFQSL